MDLLTACADLGLIPQVGPDRDVTFRMSPAATARLTRELRARITSADQDEAAAIAAFTTPKESHP